MKIKELFLISDKWLNKWKEYSCINYYSSEEIKSQPYNYEKLRKQNKFSFGDQRML